jgi:hydroxymethylpyrimidine pyrophosphatase-like HAD family hydrolase
MGNAPQQVKEAADYVTTDVRKHGVVHALQHLGLLSRG